jgi:hypothetical protein
MEIEIDVFYILLFFGILLNLFISLFLYKRDDLDSFQKGAQIILVWLIPFLAAIGLWLFHRNSDEDGDGKRKPGGGHNSSDSTDVGMRD